MDGRKLGYLIEKGRRDYNGDLAITRWIMTAFFFILAVGIGVTVLQAVVSFCEFSKLDKFYLVSVLRVVRHIFFDTSNSPLGSNATQT